MKNFFNCRLMAYLELCQMSMMEQFCWSHYFFQLFIIFTETLLQTCSTEFTYLSICEAWLKPCITTAQAEGNYAEGDKKVTKMKLVRVWITDKSHHLCILHIFLYCFAICNLDSNMLKSISSLT